MGAVSIFAEAGAGVYKNRFVVGLHLANIAGGVPSNQKVIEGWLKSKFTSDTGDQIREAVLDTIAERGDTDLDEAVKEVAAMRSLNGFKRDENGLYIEGRQAKAMIKEAACIRWPKGKWGETRKGTKGFFAEHVFVEEQRIHLGVTEPSRVNQRFGHLWTGTVLNYEEVVDEADLSFTVVTDHDFATDEWAALWVTAEKNGLGAVRSQGFGRFVVTSWEKA